MRSMIIRLEDYLEKKELELNVEKTKIMRFRKGRGEEGGEKKRDWKRNENEGKRREKGMEEVKEYIF